MGGCGFLGAGCASYCDLTMDQTYDHGCGCDKGNYCLDIDCKLTSWTKWSKCQTTKANGKSVNLVCNRDAPIVHGTKTRTRSVITHQKNDGAPCGAKEETKECDSHNCVQDCKVSGWTPWSVCDKRCGAGVQTRTRTVTVQPGEGGKACPALQESQTCNDFTCFWYTVEGLTSLERVKRGDKIITLKKKRKFQTNEGVDFLEVLPYGEAAIGTLNELGELYEQMYGVEVDSLEDDGEYSPVVQLAWAQNPKQMKTIGSIEFPAKWQDWNCDIPGESEYCEVVRKGGLRWPGEYKITFELDSIYADPADCCQAVSAECIACKREMSVEEVCTSKENWTTGVLEGCGNMECLLKCTPGATKTADCLACQMDMSKSEFCALMELGNMSSDKNVQVDGC